MTLTIARTLAFVIFSGLIIAFSAIIFGYHFVLLHKGFNQNLIVQLVGIAFVFAFAPGTLKDFVFKSTALEGKKVLFVFCAIVFSILLCGIANYCGYNLYLKYPN